MAAKVYFITPVNARYKRPDNLSWRAPALYSRSCLAPTTIPTTRPTLASQGWSSQS